MKSQTIYSAGQVTQLYRILREMSGAIQCLWIRKMEIFDWHSKVEKRVLGHRLSFLSQGPEHVRYILDFSGLLV